MNLVTSSDDLFTYRISEIKRLIRVLSSNKHLHINSFSSKGAQMFTASDVPERFSIEHEKHRFETTAENMTAGYFEVWIPLDQKNLQYYLKNSYLHLYLQDKDYVNTKPNAEFILVHTDANISNTEAHYKYKKTTHLHFQDLPYNLEHSHIALDLGLDDKMYDSREIFNKSLARTFLMIREQVLDLIVI